MGYHRSAVSRLCREVLRKWNLFSSSLFQVFNKGSAFKFGEFIIAPNETSCKLTKFIIANLKLTLRLSLHCVKQKVSTIHDFLITPKYYSNSTIKLIIPITWLLSLQMCAKFCCLNELTLWICCGRGHTASAVGGATPKKKSKHTTIMGKKKQLENQVKYLISHF